MSKVQNLFSLRNIQNRTIEETEATEDKNNLVKKPGIDIEFNKTFEKTYWLPSLLLNFPHFWYDFKAVVNSLI